MLLSIIIPCYNAGSYIKRAIESIVSQKKIYDYEIIIVNDGSTDNSQEIVMRISKEYSFVNVISQTNKGVSAARNVGLQIAQGNYCYFMDADDVLADTFFRKTHKLLQKDYDMIVFGFNYNRKKNSFSAIYPKSTAKTLLSDFLLGKTKISICSMIINRSLISHNDIKFDENTAYAEDHEFIVKLLLRSSRIHILKEILYNYMYCETSVMHSPVYSLKRFTSVLAWERIYREVCRTTDNVKLQKAAYNRWMTTYIIHTKLYRKTDDKDKAVEQLFKKYIHLIKKFPYIQFSKFFIYNFINCISYHIKNRMK